MKHFKMAAVQRPLCEGDILFDAESSNWHPDGELNGLFLRGTISYLEQLKLMRGHLFLNEVYDNLGMARTFAGQTSGWWHTDVTIELSESVHAHSFWLHVKVEQNIHKNLT